MSHAQGVPLPPKTKVVDTASRRTETTTLKQRDTSWAIHAVKTVDTFMARLYLRGDDGTDYKPVVWLIGYTVVHNLQGPSLAEPITESMTYYTEKWVVIPGNTVISGLSENLGHYGTKK